MVKVQEHITNQFTHKVQLYLYKMFSLLTYMDKLIEHNENLDTPLYLPSHLENLKETQEFFDAPDIETKIQRHDNPHYWLQQDILQIEQFQYRFFQNIILNEGTVPQIKIF